MSYDYKSVLEQFFVSDGEITQFQTQKRSVLLLLIEDMKYCIQVPGKWREFNIFDEKWKELQKNLPSFTVVLQFCSGVDLLARIWKAKMPNTSENNRFFKSCLRRWYGIGSSLSVRLWQVRNGMSHGYSLLNESGLKQYGSNQLIVRDNSEHYTLYLHAMYTSTVKAKEKLYEFIKNQKPERQRSIARFIETHAPSFSLRSTQ